MKYNRVILRHVIYVLRQIFFGRLQKLNTRTFMRANIRRTMMRHLRRRMFTQDKSLSIPLQHAHVTRAVTIITALCEKNYIARWDEEGTRNVPVTISSLLIILSGEKSKLRFLVKANFRINSPVRSHRCVIRYSHRDDGRRGFKYVRTTRNVLRVLHMHQQLRCR